MTNFIQLLKDLLFKYPAFLHKITFFVSHLCRACVSYVSLLLHWCRTCVARVSLEAHFCSSCRTWVTRSFTIAYLNFRETQNALQLPLLFFSFFSFFCQRYPGLQNYKSVFPILKISQHGGSKRM